jgi:uncharacterized protein YceH (UPF0502 family)
MGEMSPPTAADYAWAAASDAKRHGDSLEARVHHLEEVVARLQKALSEHLISSGDNGE